MKLHVGVGILVMIVGCTEPSPRQLSCGVGTTLLGSVCVVSGTGSNVPERTCGSGTHQDGNVCLPDISQLTCGIGTHRDGDVCLADGPGVTCGTGTHQEGDVCLADGPGVTCGAGTHEDSNVCVLDAPALSCGTGTHQDGNVCLPDAPALTCGTGTHQDGNLCLPDDPMVTCGPGTHRDGGLCLPDGPIVTCGPGTHLDGSVCLPDGPGITCGPGTHQDGNVCLPDAAPVICGPGTHQDGDTCLPDVVCGPGTHQDGGACVPTDHAIYEMRVSSPAFEADGRTKVPVLLIGTLPDGSPATDRVVLTTDRPAAGSFVNPQLTLGGLGTIAMFVPCNATAAGCTGAVRLSLALASAPGTEVAHLDVTLTEPAGVANPALCLTADKAMFFDGNDFIFNGTMTVTSGVFTGTGAHDSLTVHVVPSNPAQGAFWDLRFDSKQLGSDLLPGVYENAMRQPFATAGHPGLEVTGNFRGCNTISGRFQVHFFELEPDQSTVKRALVSFEQHCEGGTPLLSGCIHIE